LKKVLIYLLKYGTSAAIVAYLVWDAQRNDSFRDLWTQPKNWLLLLAAWTMCMAMVATTIVRWYYLVRALDLPFTMKDAFRLGFLGYLLNFVSVGSVGGDLFKAIFIAREHRGRRPEAVATVVIDRIIGLYALFVVATVALLCTDLAHSPLAEIRTIAKATYICTAIGAAGILWVLTPGFTRGAVSEMLETLPKVGPIVVRLIVAVRMYRRRLRVLTGTFLMSLAVHAMGALGIYLAARGLGGNVPSLGYHFVIVPMGMIVGILPLPMSGLGAFEAVLEFLYMNLGGELAVAKGQGLVVALAYRIITVTIAIVGLFYYLGSRREVAEAMKEGEAFEAQEAASLAGSDSPILSVPDAEPASR
jgi:uncharacterized protein (TIRG00374 family)